VCDWVESFQLLETELNGRPKRDGNGNYGHCWKLGSDSSFILRTRAGPQWCAAL